MNSVQKVPDEAGDAHGEPAAQPDVGADRHAPGKDVEVGGTRRDSSRPALNIKEIEQLEDDAPGG
jgi:hypothetical protein